MKKALLYLLVFGVVLMFPAFLELIGFYKVNDPIQSRNLVIEGWLDSESIENTPFDYNGFDSVFVVGLKTAPQWHKVKQARKENFVDKAYHRNWMLTDGYLFLKNFERVNNANINNISITAEGTSAKGHNAHFFLMVKDSVIGDAYVKETSNTFKFQVNLNKNQLEYLNVYFNNDVSTENEDINMLVNEIQIDHDVFVAENNDFLYLKSIDNELFRSNAQRTANLISINLKKDSKLFVIDTLFKKRNKTLAAACSFAEFVQKNKLKISSLNIYTLDYHSRRTRLAYKKALKSDVKIGMYINPTNESFKFRPSNLLSWYLRSIGHFASWFITLITFR